MVNDFRRHNNSTRARVVENVLNVVQHGRDVLETSGGARTFERVHGSERAVD